MANQNKLIQPTLGGFADIPTYVAHKMKAFSSAEHSMKTLYALMFSEQENIIGESTDGYRIKKTSYGECRANADRKTRRLMCELQTVARGSFVGIYLENSLDWIECFWAVLQAGYKPLLMNMRLPDEILEGVITTYGVCAVISESKQFSCKNISLHALKTDGEMQEIDPARFENEVYLMSSNTSGNLKICGYTGEEFYYQIKDSADIIRESASIKRHYNGSLKLLTFLPFYHIFGLVAVYVWFCFFARTLVFLKNINPKTILNTVKKHNVTHIFAVPLFWETVYRSAMTAIKGRGEKTYHKFLKGMKLSEKLGASFRKKAFREVRENIFGESVQFMISGGGYLSQDVMQFMNGIGYHLVNGYGMTELGITSVELSEKAKERNLCSVGKPFTSLEYKIQENGELWVRGKSVSHKIYTGGTCTVIEDGAWFNTHDLFALRGGRYYIEGRKDDLIIGANGENFNPNLLETELQTEGVERVAMLPAANGKMLVLAQLNRCMSRERVEHAQKALADRVVALNLTAVTEKILLTTTPLIEADDFKVNRKKLAQKLKEGKLHVMDPDRVQEEIDGQDKELIARITQIFATALNRSAEEIGADAHFFFDLGGSSLDYFSMITNVQSEFGVSFPMTGEASVSTVREMLTYLKQNG